VTTVPAFFPAALKKSEIVLAVVALQQWRFSDMAEIVVRALGKHSSELLLRFRDGGHR
jgi:hypothetical protein